MDSIELVQTRKNQLFAVICGLVLVCGGWFLWTIDHRVIGALCLTLFVPLTGLAMYNAVVGKLATLTMTDSSVDDTSLRVGPIAFVDIDGLSMFEVSKTVFIALEMNEAKANEYLSRTRSGSIAKLNKHIAHGALLNLHVSNYDEEPVVILKELGKRWAAYHETHSQ